MFVLTRGLPHRVQDLTAGNVGDNPTPAWSRTNAGQSTDASVDSERTRLWQDLDLFAQVVVSPLDDHSPLIKIVADAGLDGKEAVCGEAYWRAILRVTG